MYVTRQPHLIRSRALALVAVFALVAGACDSGSGTTSSSTTTEPAPTTTTVTTTPETTTTTTPPEPTTTTTTIATPEPIPIDPAPGWELVWNDEFDGDQIDRTNWGFDIGGWGWGNGEAQYYTDRPENARVQNGLLIIEARQEKFENSYYTSARLKTQGLQEFQYGRFEARIKVPEGAGLWPAFWMLGADFVRDETTYHSNWPHVGEIDIMEYVGRDPTLVFGTVHGPGYAGATGIGRWNRQEHQIADEFHVFAIEWDFEGVRWFYDGDEYFYLPRDFVGNREWVFDRPFFMLLNLALGGTFPGPLALSLKFPVYMYVDYVRVYQRTDDGA